MSKSMTIEKKIAQKIPEYVLVKHKRQTVQEIEAQFHTLESLSVRESKMSDLFYRLLLTKPKTEYGTAPPVVIDSNGEVRPYWMGLFQQVMRPLEQMKKVSVADFGAVGDGQTDCTEAFRKAIGNGRCWVTIPPGVYRTRGLRLPSQTILTGAGMDETILVLADEAPKKEPLLTNQNHWKGNRCLSIANLTLDWNVERLTEEEKTSAGGTASSGITLAHVQFAKIEKVRVLNPGLHGVDITSVRYNYFGDGRRSILGSRFIWVDEIEAAGYGDDGITTHHSDDILITHSYLHHPSGRAHRPGFSNSNGIEIDDGSQRVVLANNHTAYGFGGVEIKAHQTSSAASDTQIIGHYSEQDNRAYNFRHIGHHQGNDRPSQSAYGIRAGYLVAVSPQKTDLYTGSTPRALVVSAYQKVAISQFYAQAGQEENPIAISVQYRANNVSIQKVMLEGYEKAAQPIRIAENTAHVAINQ